MSFTRLDYENMRSRTERARKSPEQAVKDEVEDLHKPILKWCKDNNVAFIHCRTDKKSRATAGAPDFTICWRGYVFLIECKSADGALSPPQAAWKRQAEDHRVPVHIISSMADFYDTMDV